MSATGLILSGVEVAPGNGPIVLGGVDLLLEPGKLAVLVGPSGAGKTTLLRAIAGLEEIRRGRIEIGGVDQGGVPANKRRVAMVFQEPRLLPHLSVADNVALPLRAMGAARGERLKAAGRTLGELGLHGFEHRSVSALSGGEQQRVALARALCAKPDLLLLDEPLAALDPNRRESLRRLIAETQERRELTTLAVTHDRSEAAELGSSIALMLDGVIVQHDAPQAMFERPETEAVARFFGTVNLLRIPGEANDTVCAIRPEHVVVGPGDYRATVAEATYRGDSVKLVLDWQGQRVEASVGVPGAPAAGEVISFSLPRERRWQLPRETEELRGSGEPARGAAPPSRRQGP